MSAPRRSVWPIARLERVIAVASVAFALVAIVATAAHALQLRSALQTAVESRLLTVARILAKEVNRTLLQTRGLLDQVDEQLRVDPSRPDGTLGRLLESMPRQQTLLREIAVVDAAGRIVASSDARAVGTDVSAYDFAREPRDGRLRVGRPNSGRGLRTGSPGGDATDGAYSGFLTVSRATSGRPDPPLVVAVIGTDSLVADLRFVSSDDGGALTLYRYDGPPLATSDPATLRRGADPHPIFERFVPERETGGFTDAPSGGAAWLAHFDTTADFPVLVDVRLPQREIDERWEAELVAPGLILLVTLAAIGLYARMTMRALRLRQRSEKQAATQERRLRNILETAADGIVTMDRRGIVREYNRAAESIFGVPAAEAIGRPLSDVLPADHAASHQASVDRYLNSGTGSVIGRSRTLRTTRRDGRQIELNLAVSEVVDQGERLFTGIVRDVTEVRRAEERFRTLFLRSGEPHLLFDRDRIVDCNEAAAALLRASGREALLGLRVTGLAAPVQPGGPAADVLADAVATARRDGVHRLVWAARALDGAEFPVEMSLTPIAADERDEMLAAWHDISERRRHEEQLRKARDDAESAASAKARFLAMMSHELRTPMTGITGMIELLRDTRLTDEQRRLVDVLGHSAQSLLTVLNDVLDYSKIEAGRLQLERIDFRPAGVAREVGELLSTAASQRGDTLSIRWHGADREALCGDPTRLRQVLINLVGNAIKFTERGRISVEGGTRPLPDGRVELGFEVSDTGIGIPPEVLPTLFRPFQQADTSTTRRFGGTGLGLAICRHLVEAMDGTIDVRSRPGEGSTFRFVVRVAPARSGELAPAPAPPAPPVRGLRILVAEDNPTNRLLLGTRLRRAAHRVDEVDDGLQAIEAVRRTRYDVVLMDMQMPHLDGVGATRAIRAMPEPTCRVPIVALTADALPEARERYMASGLDDYLTKPIDWHALEAVLRRHAPGPAPAAASAPAAESATADLPDAAGPAADAVADSPAGYAADAAPSRAPSGPAPDRPRPDEASVAAMQEDLGEAVWATVLEVYWPKAIADVAACRIAVAEGDAAAHRAAAHSLKGASLSLGFDSVGILAAGLEYCDPAQAQTGLLELERAFAAIRAAWSVDPVPAGD